MRSRLALAVAAVALAAACGGEDDSVRLSRAEFVEQADAICADADGQIAALGEPTSLGELAEYGAEAIAINEEAFAALRALDAPEELQAQLDEAYGLLERQIELSRELVAAAEAGESDQVNAVGTEIGQVNDRADAIARDIGLRECGSD